MRNVKRNFQVTKARYMKFLRNNCAIELRLSVLNTRNVYMKISTPYKDIRVDPTIIPCQSRLSIRLLHDLRTMIEGGRSSRED